MNISDAGDQESAIVLHRRAYRETSLLLELLTPQHGRVALVARGARRKGADAGLLQPFQLLKVSWRSRSDLGTLTDIESAGAAYALRGSALYCGLYLNELLLRLLRRWVPVADLYALYCGSVSILSTATRAEEALILRQFEWGLIECLGYGFTPVRTAAGMAVESSKTYRFRHDTGLCECAAGSPECIDAEHLRLLGAKRWTDMGPATLAIVRRINQQILKPLLGSKPLSSRLLYRSSLALGRASIVDTEAEQKE